MPTILTNNPVTDAAALFPSQREEIKALRAACWEAAGKDPQRINKVRQHLLKADKGTAAPDTVYYWQRVLIMLQQPKRPSRKAKYQLLPEHRDRYITAYRQWQTRFPNWVKDGHTLDPLFPDTSTANGLTTFIVNHINWTGGNASRIHVQGQQVIEKHGSQVVSHGYRKTNTAKGRADVGSTIRGRSCQWEVKIGSDKPSPKQLEQQARERAAGGEYFFTHSVEEYFSQYDSLS
jgi:hypothetical protein